MGNNSITSGLRKTPIWPDYELIEYTDYDAEENIYKKGFGFNSLVRKKGDDGLYYLTPFRQMIRFCVEKEWQSVSRLHEFTRKNIIECYNFMICGKIIPHLKNTFEEPVFILDDNQESEEERLSKQYLF